MNINYENITHENKQVEYEHYIGSNDMYLVVFDLATILTSCYQCLELKQSYNKVFLIYKNISIDTTQYEYITQIYSIFLKAQRIQQDGVRLDQLTFTDLMITK